MLGAQANVIVAGGRNAGRRRFMGSVELTNDIHTAGPRAEARVAPFTCASRRALLRALAGWSLVATLPPSTSRLRAAGSGAPGNAGASGRGAHSALIIVDVQNCFVSGGSLAVPHGEDVVPVINRLAGLFAT